MDAPDELVDALAQAITLTEHGDVFIGPQIPGMQVGYIAPSGRAAIADALRAAERDAKVAEIVTARCGCSEFEAIAALYPETGNNEREDA